MLVDRFGCGQFDDKVCIAAAGNVNPGAMRRLLAEGVRPSRCLESNKTTLCHVAAKGGHVDTLQYLLAAGADLDALDNDRKSPCAVAAQAGRGAIVELLLRSGARLPSAFDAMLHVDIFERLVAAGADLRWDFDSALDFCMFDIVDDRVVDFVLAADVRGQQRQAQVELAVHLGRIDAFRRLRRSADVDCRKLVLVAAMCDAPSALQRARQRTRVTHAVQARVRRANKAQLLRELFAIGVQFNARESNWLSFVFADSAYQRDAFATVVASGMDLEMVDRLVSLRNIGAPYLAAVGYRPYSQAHGEELVVRALQHIATQQFHLLRVRGCEICVGLQALDMSALQLCEILSYAFAPLESIVPFHKLWKIATKVKHFEHTR
jgi:hypothetical protein